MSKPNDPSANDAAPDGGGEPKAEQSASGPPSPQQNNETRLYCEGQVRRIVDVCAGFTPEDMELVEALGFGLAKRKSGG
jgi:hypothetical protein